MAQPPAYNREKNFTLNSGRETDHAALNAELDRASNSINDIRTNLAILQADDGKLRPAVVTSDSISMELRTTLVEGVVMDAQSMLDKSLEAAAVSSASAKSAKASEEKALESSLKAAMSAKEAEESARVLSLAINSDWEATEGAAQILNRPELSAVATSGSYEDLNDLPDNLATDSDIALLQEEIAKKGVPVGTVEYFAMTTPPPGYLKADGAAIGRETYPELFAAIGTTFGKGNGSTTFNLPDLIDRFAQGSNTPGQKIEAGLPNIEASLNPAGAVAWQTPSGAFSVSGGGAPNAQSTGTWLPTLLSFSAAKYNPIYGASDSVQPPALTLLPCIKAFEAATNPGLMDITRLANEMAGKVDRYIDNKPVRYVIDAYNDSNNWYRKWSDGWVEQGGILKADAVTVTLIFLMPFANINYSISKNIGGTSVVSPYEAFMSFYDLTATSAKTSQGGLYMHTRWYACGQGA